jgi:hypothetical protein
MRRLFGENDHAAPAPHGSRFDRSFLAIAMAVGRLGVALESIRLAKCEIRNRKLLAPLAGRVTDVRYVGQRSCRRSSGSVMSPNIAITWSKSICHDDLQASCSEQEARNT